MKKYQYQIVKYMHDRVTSEFVNIGIVLYQQDGKFLDSKFITRYSRLSHFFGEINGQYIISSLKQFSKEINNIHKNINDHLSDTEYSSIESITGSILPVDDSALICSEVFHGIDISPEKALDDLFERLINKYNSEPTKNLTDESVWRKVYKSYFDELGITSHLKPHTVHTNHDEIEFDLAWKNGSWNIYQSLLLDLKSKDSIKSKVYKWNGIISELENTNEKLHIYLLTKTPHKDKTLNKFINDTLICKKGDKFQVTLVHESEAEEFASSVKKEMEVHS